MANNRHTRHIKIHMHISKCTHIQIVRGACHCYLKLLQTMPMHRKFVQPFTDPSESFLSPSKRLRHLQKLLNFFLSFFGSKIQCDDNSSVYLVSYWSEANKFALLCAISQKTPHNQCMLLHEQLHLPC